MVCTPKAVCLLVLLLVTYAVADFYCKDETLTWDVPTAILTDGTVRVQNCTLHNLAIWCAECDCEIDDSRFWGAPPCPVLGGLISGHIHFTDNSLFKCNGHPEVLSVYPHGHVTLGYALDLFSKMNQPIIFVHPDEEHAYEYAALLERL